MPAFRKVTSFKESIAAALSTLPTSEEQFQSKLKQEIDLLIGLDQKDLEEVCLGLNILLDLTQLGVCAAEFIRLLEYLNTFDPEAALIYWYEFDADY